MGLAAAYRAAKNGHEVDLIEAAPEPGGMAGHFDFDGVSIERFYHFICKTDYPTFELLDELGIGSMRCNGARPRWALSREASCIAGVTPLRCCASRISRCGRSFAMVCSLLSPCAATSGRPSSTRMRRAGSCAGAVKRYIERLWQPLFDYKFYEYADNVSASWIWTRIRRIGRSRREHDAGRARLH